LTILKRVLKIVTLGGVLWEKRGPVEGVPEEGNNRNTWEEVDSVLRKEKVVETTLGGVQSTRSFVKVPKKGRVSNLSRRRPWL